MYLNTSFVVKTILSTDGGTNGMCVFVRGCVFIPEQQIKQDLISLWSMHSFLIE